MRFEETQPLSIQQTFTSTRDQMGASPPSVDETKWTDHVIKFEFPMRPVVWWIYVPSFAGIYRRNEEGWCCKNTA